MVKSSNMVKPMCHLRDQRRTKEHDNAAATVSSDAAATNLSAPSPSLPAPVSHLGFDDIDDGGFHDLKGSEDAKQLDLGSIVIHPTKLKELVHLYKHTILFSDYCNRGSSGTVPTIFLYGQSGAGKSHLVREQFVAKAKTHSSTSPYYLEGSCNSGGHGHPFIAIAQALTSFFHQVLQQALPEEMKRVSQAVRSVIIRNDDDNHDDQHAHQFHNAILLKLIPAMKPFLKSQERRASLGFDIAEEPALNGGDDDFISIVDSQIAESSGWNQLQNSFVELIRAISNSKKHPIILFLDDLQYLSQIESDLIRTVLSVKTMITGFMFIGGVQISNDAANATNAGMSTSPTTAKFKAPLKSLLGALDGIRDDKHKQQLQHQQQKKKDADQRTFKSELTQETIQTTHFNDIYLDNVVNQSTISAWLMRLLILNQSDVQFLAAKIFSVTKGRVYMTIQYIEYLEQSEILSYDHAIGRWKWPEEKYDAFDTVEEMIALKLKALSPDVQHLLAVASSLRTPFDLSTIESITIELMSSSTDNNKLTKPPRPLSEILKDAVSNGMLLINAAREYRFVNNTIQKVVSDLLVTDDLLQQTGKCVLELHEREKAPTSMLTTMIFVASDNLNGIHNNIMKDDTLQINIKAGYAASSMAAIQDAARYFEIAFRLLGKNPWKDNPHALKLYRGRAHVEIILGNFEVGYELCEEALENANTVEAKLPFYSMMGAALGRQDRIVDSLAMNRTGAQLLGKYPLRNFMGHGVKAMMAVKLYFNRASDEVVLVAPAMTNQHHIMAARFLSQIILRSWACQNVTEFVLATLKIILMSVKSGITEDTGLAFGCYGLLLGKTGDQKNAVRFANLARQVMDMTQSRSLMGVAHDICSRYVYCWSTPAESYVRGYFKAFVTHTESGDYEAGLEVWLRCHFLLQWEGFSLSALHESHQALLKQMDHFEVTANLKDCAKEHAIVPAILGGHVQVDWIAVKAFGTTAEYDQEKSSFWLIGYMVRIYLSVYFGKYEIAEGLVDRLDATKVVSPSYQMTMTRILYGGLAMSGRYRETGKNKYLVRLRDLRRQSRKVSKSRGNSSYNRSLLLKAELATTKTNQNSQVLETYNYAIDAAIQTGKTNEAALGCELAGEYLVRAGISIDLASDYVTKACKYYSQWGAVAKVEELKSRHGNLIDGEALKSIDPVETGINLELFYVRPTTVVSNDAHSFEGRSFLVGGQNEIVGNLKDAPAANGDGDDISVLTGI